MPKPASGVRLGESTTFFTKDTFAYFDESRLHSSDLEWFEKNRERYQTYVDAPFRHLVLELDDALSSLVPGILFDARKVSKPSKGSRQGAPVIRDKTYAYYAQPASSQFEMNPGIYLSIGAADEDNVYGCGIYEPSARQMRALRPKLQEDFDTIHANLQSRTLKKYWGELSGTRYQRFPKGFSEEDRSARYLWHKQFFLSQTPSRETITQPDFTRTVVAAMKAAVPFLEWTRQAVGVYRKPAQDRDGI